MAKVVSTAIDHVQYDETNKLLHIRFRSGSTTYTYVSVPKPVYEALMRAPSKGRYFAAHIAKRYSLKA